MLPAKVEETTPAQGTGLRPLPDVPEIHRDGCSYQLAGYTCPSCGKDHYRVARFAGAFYTLYIPPDDFEPDDFEAYCEDLHENLQFDRRYVLDDVRRIIEEQNCPSGIQSDASYLDQLVDFARVRIIELQKMGLLPDGLESDPKSKVGRVAVLAFELGFAASELRLKDFYEDAIFEGWRLQEGREAGREAAAQAKQRQTKKTREAIRDAAIGLFKADPKLARNDAATARAIEGMHLPALCRHGQKSIGSEAIAKHIRALHQEGQL